jgi:phenylalanyl-tRNA synthetase beta chain
VEEVARLYGYNNIPALLPEKVLELPRENIERSLEHKTRVILSSGLGFTEVMNYSFYGKDRLEKCGLDEKDHLKVLNYLSLDQSHMRTTLTPNLLANIAANARDRAVIKIFELGHIYKEVGEFMPLEEKRLTAAVAENGEAFYAAKGALEVFLKEFHVSKYELKSSTKMLPYAHPKKSVDLIVKGKTVGVLFTVHPGVLRAFDIPQDVAMFSVDFTKLISLGRELTRFQALAKFPALPFDISILVDHKKTVAEMEAAIRSTDASGLIESVKLFDIYEGKNIPEGQKSLSFNVTLRHPDRTLTDLEFQTLYSSVGTALAAAGGTIRGL